MIKGLITNFIETGTWRRRGVVLALSGLVGIAPSMGGKAESRDPDLAKQIAFFDSKIHPLLEAHCFKCHGAEKKLKGELRLTSRKGLLAGGDLGAVFDEKNPDNSLLLRMISYKDEDHQMPPKGKLPESAIGALTEWVRLAAPYNPAREIHGPVQHESKLNQVNEETKNYWAFRPVKRPPTPKISDPDWSKTPIDGLIFEKLAAGGLKPNGPASQQQLIRRAFFDLIGLPPTLREVSAFENDHAPNAFEKVIDALLSRPQYGEKWGRHWLDLVRYAESNGYERDNPKPYVWQYRDYVIKAFNEDKPYSRFIMEQLAGDELKPFSRDAYVATGYYRLGLWDDEPVDPQQAYYDGLDDIISITGQSMLGLTIGCARCHDHKIDPIPQKDYYSMVAFLNNIRHYGNRSAQTVMDHSVRALIPPFEAEKLRKSVNENQSRLRNAERPLKKLDKRANEQLKAGEKDDYRHESNRIPLLRKYIGDWVREKEFNEYVEGVAELKKLHRELAHGNELGLVVTENGSVPPEQHLFIRGNVHAKGPEVSPAFLSIVSPPEPKIGDGAGPLSTGRRTALARWIASKENPLTARVFMNRLWQHHFGRGIVRSSENFGRLGEQPTHPELLNWLAAEFMAGDWKIKRMHKLIMLSRSYQMSSAGNAAGLSKDPANELFWRFNLRRLTAEEVRDSAINLTGKLNLKIGGKYIYTDVPQEVLATASRPGAAWGQSSPDDRNRRSVYVYIKRSLHEPILKAFDMADTDGHCSVRFSSVLPTQSLTMLNSKFFNDIATDFAGRLRREAGVSVKDQVELALSLALSRQPNGKEVEEGLRFVRGIGNETDADPLQRFCLLVMNLNEYMFVD